MDFSQDSRTGQLEGELKDFLVTRVGPSMRRFRTELDSLPDRWAWDSAPVFEELRKEARGRGLWNLFLPGNHGAGLTNVQYAPLAELSGRQPHLAPAAMNCAAPDTGNMEVLVLAGSPAQQEQWLEPLLEGRIRSAFAMTEPEVASSDATNIATQIIPDGNHYVVRGRKWWSTGAMNPNARMLIVMGATDPDAPRHRRQSMIIVPRDTPGVEIVRSTEVLGYDDHEHGGHAEIVFHDVRVPRENLLGQEGDGFAIAQARLGPGRIHHCMRSIGLAEVAIELMCRRATHRVAFGRALSDQGVIRDWIAEARLKVEQLRLLALKAAWLMDTVGNKGAHTEIQMIKIAAPATVQWILDKAMQVHGAGGLSRDFPLAEGFAAIRTLRIADGPDEVHKNALARAELRRHAESP